MVELKMYRSSSIRTGSPVLRPDHSVPFVIPVRPPRIEKYSWLSDSLDSSKTGDPNLSQLGYLDEASSVTSLSRDTPRLSSHEHGDTTETRSPTKVPLSEGDLQMKATLRQRGIVSPVTNARRRGISPGIAWKSQCRISDSPASVGHSLDSRNSAGTTLANIERQSSLENTLRQHALLVTALVAESLLRAPNSEHTYPRQQRDSGISGFSGISSAPLASSPGMSGTSAFSLTNSEPGYITGAYSQLPSKFPYIAEESRFNSWALPTDSSTSNSVRTVGVFRGRFSSHCIFRSREKDGSTKKKYGERTVEETERSQLLTQLHALCVRQRAGRRIDMGEIEYWLRYDFSSQVLSVLVLRAENVGGQAPSEKVNTYVRLTLETDSSVSQKTRVVKNTRDPTYDHEMTFILDLIDVQFAVLEVRVLRRRKLSRMLTRGPGLLGMVSRNLNGLLMNPVEQIREDLVEEPEKVENPARMNLSLCYNPRRRTLEVTIVKVANLLSSNIFSRPDTEVKVEINQVTSGEVETIARKTRTKRWNANPVYKEMFSFPVSRVSNLRDAMYVTCTVACQDYLSKKKDFGAIGLGLSATQDSERSHWADMLANPGYPCNKWHRLVGAKLTQQLQKRHGKGEH